MLSVLHSSFFDLAALETCCQFPWSSAYILLWLYLFIRCSCGMVWSLSNLWAPRRQSHPGKGNWTTEISTCLWNYSPFTTFVSSSSTGISIWSDDFVSSTRNHICQQMTVVHATNAACTMPELRLRASLGNISNHNAEHCVHGAWEWKWICGTKKTIRTQLRLNRICWIYQVSKLTLL